MANPPRLFFNHSRHTLKIYRQDATFDVLAFHGEERLSQPFSYHIEFTCTVQDLPLEQILNKRATFTLHERPVKPSRYLPKSPVVGPLRTFHGVITAFKRLSASKDEARYEVTLQPRLARLERGQQYRIYQDKSVPQIVEHILRSRHGFRGQDFYFNIEREYPRRAQVMQYGESDLAFIDRLLAEVGLWYRFTSDDRLGIEVVEFHDSQAHYQYGIELPHGPPTGLDSHAKVAAWQLQAEHRVVEKHINIRSYDPRNAKAFLDGEIDQTRGAKTTYGEAYHYAEPYTELGDRYDFDHKVQCESGYFYARLRHQRYLNSQTVLKGVSNSPSLAPGQVLKLTGNNVPQAFAERVVITHLKPCAARDRSFISHFEAIPYFPANNLCYRPPLLPKPSIAGTVPARVTNPQKTDPYADIDSHGRYRVQFLFDRDEWPAGRASCWLRLARPYAGDTYGLHLPLLAGTEVAVGFEQGDPDRPYIAHALHDSNNPDHVALYNYKRNVLRTPANNKLRLDDTRGQEHIKLSTEQGGKSQLNLGHLVDGERKPRGVGFELRSDSHGAIRAGGGLLISAEAQPKAQGQQLEMSAPISRLQQACEQLQELSVDAQAAGVEPADVAAQVKLLRQELEQLKASVLLLSAPQGIALSSGEHLQLAAEDNLMLNAGGQADFSIAKRLFMGVGQGLNLFVRKLGIKLVANQGPVSVQAQNDTLELLARKGLHITSTEDEIFITAKKKITLNGGGSYFTLDQCKIEAGTLGDYNIKAPHFDYFRVKAPDPVELPTLPIAIDPPREFTQQYHIFESDGETVMPGVRYRITSESGQVWKGITDSQGWTERVRTVKSEALSLVYDYEEEEEEEELPVGIVLRLGLFFDGTGNNEANAALTAQCRREDLALFEESELEAIVELCEAHGFGEFDGDGFMSGPDNSYGNAPSNVVHLHELYPDSTATPITSDEQLGYVKVYLEGIGTHTGGPDSIYGQGWGQGETGVVLRVKQASAVLEKTLLDFVLANPGVYIRKVEFDIFGFSRGAAAARHCVNELLKPGRGVFAELLQPGRFTLLTTFDPAVDVSLNLIGLFDTVAAIAGLLQGNLSVADDINPGVNLYLPPGCARQIIQLQARDEHRHNFALNSVRKGHREICLPGVHSDIGGGYRPRSRERLWLSMPRRLTLPVNTPLERVSEWQQANGQAKRLRASGLAGDGSIEVKMTPIVAAPQGDRQPTQEAFWLELILDRPVRGELGLIGLRVMHELAVLHGVPFKSLDERPDWALPEDLQPIAARILEQVLAGQEVSLDPEQELLLLGRYIHRSAHWTPSKGLWINKPTKDAKRNVYPNQPQEGYPQ